MEGTRKRHRCNTFCAVAAAYLVVADEAYGRSIPSAFLDKIASEFNLKYAEKAVGAKESSLNSSFGYVPLWLHVCIRLQGHVDAAPAWRWDAVENRTSWLTEYSLTWRCTASGADDTHPYGSRKETVG